MQQDWKPMTICILEVCAGISSLIGGAVLAFLGVVAQGLPVRIDEHVPNWPFAVGATLFLALAIMLLAFGLLAVIGGIHALRGTSRFWPMVGAIAATFAFFPLGIPAIVLTVMSEQEASQPGSAGHRDTGAAP
jgi:hypothetical protein